MRNCNNNNNIRTNRKYSEPKSMAVIQTAMAFSWFQFKCFLQVFNQNECVTNSWKSECFGFLQHRIVSANTIRHFLLANFWIRQLSIRITKIENTRNRQRIWWFLSSRKTNSQLEHLENAIRDVSRVELQCELARAIYSSSKAHFVEWIFRIFHHVHTCSSKISVSLQNLEIVESKCFKIRIQNRTYYASGTKFPSFFSNDTFPPSTWATDHFKAKIELFPIRDFEWDNIGSYLKELRECENGGQKRRNKALKESQAQFISVWTHVFRWKFTLDTLFDTPANVIKSRTH